MKALRMHEQVFRVLLIFTLLSISCNLFTHLPQVKVNLTAGTNTPQPEKATPPVLTATSAASQPTPTPPVPLSQGPLFAVFEESPGDITALIQQEKISADLANVRNTYLLSVPQRERLVRDGFFVTPGTEKEFFAGYEKSRYGNEPIFVTSDSLLHSYHLMFDKTLRVAEEKHFIPLLKQMNQSMLAKSDEVYQQLKGTGWEEPARKLAAYFAVGSRLLDDNVQTPAYASDLVDPELANIASAAGIQKSAIFPGLENGEDYTQYIPRGHYTRSEALKAYFKSMMWYGRMTFRLKTQNPDIGKEETRSAILLVYALRNTQVNGAPALQAWADLYSPTVFFVGRSDDLTVVQYGDVLDFVYGGTPGLQQITDEQNLEKFIDLANQLPPPKILGMVIQDSDNEEEVTKGLRFMGQRFVPDAYIFRQLIYRNVGTQENRRGLPKGLDLLAAMGSERAYQLLDQMGDTKYENYPSQMQKVRSWLSGLTIPEWTETLNNAWLYSFFPLLEKPGQGYPDFMKSETWLDKQINTVLGSWAELKHDTILYAKQVYAELGGGPPPPPPLPPHGYVEPAPEFFNRLAALTAMTRTGLETRGLLSETDREGLGKLEDLARACQTMAEKELRGEKLTDDEYEKIRFYGGELEKLVILSADMDVDNQGIGGQAQMEENQQAAVIADVATDPDPSGTGQSAPIVLEVGVGRINDIYAVVPVVDHDGKTILQVVKGGVFSYYEFHWPADDRLTDEKWRQMLEEGNPPAGPEWTGSFLVGGSSYDDLANSVHYFQNDITSLYWGPLYYLDNLTAVQEQFRNELTTLVQARQYIGHQLLNFTFRSFDMQSETRAVVTTRENWKDTLYTYSGSDPNYDETASAERGPYSLDVTYILEKSDASTGNQWQVIQVQFMNQPPAW